MVLSVSPSNKFFQSMGQGAKAATSFIVKWLYQAKTQKDHTQYLYLVSKYQPISTAPYKEKKKKKKLSKKKGSTNHSLVQSPQHRIQHLEHHGYLQANHNQHEVYSSKANQAAVNLIQHQVFAPLVALQENTPTTDLIFNQTNIMYL